METLKNPLEDFISSVLSLYRGLYVHFWRNYEGRQLWGTKMKIVVVTTNYKNLASG